MPRAAVVVAVVVAVVAAVVAAPVSHNDDPRDRDARVRVWWCERGARARVSLSRRGDTHRPFQPRATSSVPPRFVRPPARNVRGRNEGTRFEWNGRSEVSHARCGQNEGTRFESNGRSEVSHTRCGRSEGNASNRTDGAKCHTHVVVEARGTLRTETKETRHALRSKRAHASNRMDGGETQTRRHASNGIDGERETHFSPRRRPWIPKPSPRPAREREMYRDDAPRARRR
jgi:hypothetical protein